MKNFIKIHPDNPHYFADSTGKTWIPVGLNMIKPTPEGGMEDFRIWIKKLAENGGNYFRIWLSIPFFDIEPERVGSFDEEKRKRLDEVLAIAQSYGVRIKVTIEHFRGVVPEDGAPHWAVKPAANKANGGTAVSIEDYLLNEPSRQAFLKKLDYLAERYRDNDTIFAWELWNEVGCFKAPDCVWQQWSEEMIDELRKRFPNHLVTSNLCSFDCLERHNAYDWLCKSSKSDYMQIHSYLDPGAELDFCRGPIDAMCAEAIRILKEKNNSLPSVLAETGATEWRHATYSHLYKLDQKGMILHDILFAPFFCGAAGTGQIWHWEFYVNANNLWHLFEPFSRFIKDLDPAAEDFKPFTRESNHLRIYALSGKTQTIYWCRDKENTWQNEIERENPPLLRSGMELKLLTLTDRPVTQVDYFLPWAPAEQATGSLLPDERTVVKLPDFERSIILILRHDGETAFSGTASRMQLRENW